MTLSGIRTRFAPSPTGSMHVGNLRTALYEYLIARSLGGRFILRIEDTDQERQVEGAVDLVFRTLERVGLVHDEGPDVGGPCGPYVQSRRLPYYREMAGRLVREGRAYRCFCSRERLEALRSAKGSEFSGGYDRHCRDLPEEEIRQRLDAGMSFVIRQRMPLEGETRFVDSVFGEITVRNEELEDQVLLKSDGFPTYNFANVVDDHAMGISHVVRGSEYLSSTPKYNLLYEAFGWPIPIYVHLPLINGPDGRKLSKRHGAVSFEDLAAEGFLPAAILNYIALLGWCPKDNRERFTLPELEAAFSIDGISRSPAVFDLEKLRWFNGEYLRDLAPDAFLDLAMPWFRRVFPERDLDWPLLSSLLQPRIRQLSEIPDRIEFVRELPDHPLSLYENRKSKATPETAVLVLGACIPLFESLPEWSQALLHDRLVLLAQQLSMKIGQVMWPVRIAATGLEATPGGAIEMLAVLGRDVSLARLRAGLARLERGE